MIISTNLTTASLFPLASRRIKIAGKTSHGNVSLPLSFLVNIHTSRRRDKPAKKHLSNETRSIKRRSISFPQIREKTIRDQTEDTETLKIITSSDYCTRPDTREPLPVMVFTFTRLSLVLNTLAKIDYWQIGNSI